MTSLTSSQLSFYREIIKIHESSYLRRVYPITANSGFDRLCIAQRLNPDFKPKNLETERDTRAYRESIRRWTLDYSWDGIRVGEGIDHNIEFFHCKTSIVDGTLVATSVIRIHYGDGVSLGLLEIFPELTIGLVREGFTLDLSQKLKSKSERIRNDKEELEKKLREEREVANNFGRAITWLRGRK